MTHEVRIGPTFMGRSDTTRPSYSLGVSAGLPQLDKLSFSVTQFPGPMMWAHMLPTLVNLVDNRFKDSLSKLNHNIGEYLMVGVSYRDKLTAVHRS